MAGDIVYFDIGVPDAHRAKVFYGGLFGWRFEAGNVPGGSQVTNVSPPGGLYEGGEASSPRVYFQVDDLLATKLRGTPLRGQIEVVAEVEGETEKRLLTAFRLD